MIFSGAGCEYAASLWFARPPRWPDSDIVKSARATSRRAPHAAIASNLKSRPYFPPGGAHETLLDDRRRSRRRAGRRLARLLPGDRRAGLWAVGGGADSP